MFAGPASADTLIDNVKGISLDEAGKVVRFTALVVGDDGKIIRLITENIDAQMRKNVANPNSQSRYRVDGKGRVLIPGLIDSHAHIISLGIQSLTLDLSDTHSLDEAKAKISSYALAHPERKWIIGGGWNHEQWKMSRFPTAADLADIGGGRPIWLKRIDGHAGWANDEAMKAAGVGAQTMTTSGGRIERIAGRPSGVFVDAAMDLFRAAIPTPLSKERDVAFFKAQEMFLANGITSVADMGTSVEDWLAFRRAGDRGGLQMRIFAYSAGLGPMLQIAGGEPTPWLYDSKLRMAGVKLLLDGALGSRGAWLKQPYADKPAERGFAILSEASLLNQMSRATMDGFQVAVHAIGDAANAQLLDAIAELSSSYKGDRRWRIEHAQIVDPADISRFGRNGVIASMQPVHQTSDWKMAEARLGPKRLGGAYAWASINKTGSRLAFGSDAPVENPNPFFGIAAAISRQDEKGEPYGGWQPTERLTPELALAAFTTGGAFASFAESKIGRLAPGLYADFILVDHDPLFATPDEIRTTKIFETWVGGRKVFERK